MGSYTELYIGNYWVHSTKSQVDSTIMTIFRESDKKIFERKISERCYVDVEEEDKIETAYEYSSSVSNIIARLDIMGFSLQKVKRVFQEVIEREINRLEERAKVTTYQSLSDEYLNRKVILGNSSFEEWLLAFREIFDKSLHAYSIDSQTLPKEISLLKFILTEIDEYEPPYNFPCSDIRYFLRAFLEVCPKENLVSQDITYLVHEGYYGKDEKVCEISIKELTQDYPVNEKIIILAEGSTDTNVLEKSLKLLYPHLSEYYSFMDFGLSNAQGSAGNLVNTIKAFVGSGISNRIIAIFDNDSAGFDAIRGLNKTSIPSNIRIMNYPNLEIAELYPTLGPSGLSNLDINGLACSIEIYFGKDILNIDGELSPIQWKGYIDGVKKYQGEIMNKAKLQELFNEKLLKCVTDKTLIKTTDWSGINSILLEIFKAFQ